MSAKKAKKSVKKVSKSNVVKVEDISGCIVVFKDKKLAVDSIRVSAGATISTGDYESARLDESITVRPIDKDVTIEMMQEFAWDIVKTDLVKELLIIRNKGREKNG